MNCVTLVGIVDQDPEFFRLSEDRLVSRFTLVVERDEAGDRCDYIPIAVWNRQAEVVRNHLSKGDKAAIDGRISSRSWIDPDGSARKNLEVTATRIHFLSRPKLQPDQVTPREAPRCPSCDRVMSDREAAEQGSCNDCYGGPYSPGEPC